MKRMKQSIYFLFMVVMNLYFRVEYAYRCLQMRYTDIL